MVYIPQATKYCTVLYSKLIEINLQSKCNNIQWECIVFFNMYNQFAPIDMYNNTD